MSTPNEVSEELEAQPKESFKYTKFNPALGVSAKLHNGINIFANASQGNRVPTVIELGCADRDNPCLLPTGLQADPYLEQVTSRTYELGARGFIGESKQLLFCPRIIHVLEFDQRHPQHRSLCLGEVRFPEGYYRQNMPSYRCYQSRYF